MSGFINDSTPIMTQLPVRETRLEQLGRQDKPSAVSAAGKENDERGLSLGKEPSAPDIDEYVHGEEPIPAGLYRIEKDKEGNQSIVFDDPSRQEGEQAQAPSNVDETERSEEKTEKRTVSTDKVDAEISKLKEQKKSLEQQMSRAVDNPDKQEELRSRLQQLESEIAMKDNDSYRRQHAEYTFG